MNKQLSKSGHRLGGIVTIMVVSEFTQILFVLQYYLKIQKIDSFIRFYDKDVTIDNFHQLFFFQSFDLVELFDSSW